MPRSPLARAAADLESAVARALFLLDSETNQVRRARHALELSELCRDWQEAFGEQRTLAFETLREDYDYSLNDLAIEFGITRARAAQIAVRERYKEKD